ncbi:MBL fold metallo-hydrolase [Clostridium saccharoperbutylacetonicum]|uniref:MBL fold metallo-hydrolase n=1 Tax=Clostridium saccharoperbutylacetonicum TaxID=36745 RepID=UPI000983E049|nr:MBL fold metallo-hydrolase [Clostridium saccharoperbutylacetonicum]AQR97286.1 hydroxyacylglutathione hydrolase [Clostridium saccharoperbutylacetonicum]NSB33168.1 glyoxylase-like metal-dependent hydrolase (beta-lactamase superfamily II) [Clostridium saccharoperbutylacetonicum]
MYNEYYSIRKVMDGVYHISDPNKICCTLVVGNKKALLFDTGYGIGKLKQAISSITVLPIIVVNSHGHLDHMGGNYEFDDIYIHEADITLAKQILLSDKRKWTVNNYKKNIGIPKDFSEEEYISRDYNMNFTSIKEGEIFDLGGYELEVIYCKGHTAGCISLIERKRKLLLSGDTILQHVWMFLKESEKMSDYIDSLNKLNKLEVDIILTSHSNEPYNKELLHNLIRCVNNIDISKSTPYFNEAYPYEAFMYSEGGEPFASKEYVSIVFSEDKL